MRQGDVLPWLESLIASYEHPKTYGYMSNLDIEFKQGWLTEAEAALKSVFPSNHAVINDFVKSKSKIDFGRYGTDTYINGCAGTFRTAVAVLKAGRLGTLVEAIRAESDSELLEQAETLLAHDYRVAATVIAGGALESHLKRYTDKHGLSSSIKGAGSISAYNQVIGTARKVSPDLYSANDGKLVEGWGGFRNEAAHAPGTFARSKDDVERMIGGIREFIARTT